MTRKSKLIWQIFPSFIVIIVLSLSAVTAYSTRYFKDFFLENSEKELVIRTKLLQKKFADILETDPANTRYLDDQCKDIGKQTGTRVTIVLASGKVIGDSFTDTAIMENHMKRPEIMEALRQKKGVTIRYSTTLDRDMLYVALPIIRDQQVIAVIRTSLSIRAIDDKITAARNNILIAMLFTILAAALVSLLVSRKIIHPVEQMKLGAAKFARGDLAARLTAPDSEELSELAVTMNQMAENLDEKIKAFENRSKELEAVHGSMQEGVIAIDRDERIITINAAAARILDFPPGELKTRYILEVVRNMEFQKFIENALATHEPIERDIRIAGNENLILNIHSTALYNADNQRMGTLVIFHDITRIRRLETMHKDFAANVSHELKTPLTTIKGFIETLQEMAMGQHTDEAHNFLTIIEKNVNRMVDLIDDLLALSRLERLQGTDLFFESQDIAGLIRGAVQSCEAGITAKNICVTVDCPDDLTARVDPLLLEQAIFNLVDNAVKYNPAGNPVSIAASRNGSHLKIQVTDTGAGIPSEHLPKIFNRFYRIDPSRSRNEGGTGLGLAIVKHIVQYHRGKVDVQSAKDRGSTFTICIPA